MTGTRGVALWYYRPACVFRPGRQD